MSGLVYTRGVDQDTGNTVDLAYATSLLPGGAPPGWGSRCSRFVIGAGAASGGALEWESFNPAYTDKYETDIEVMILMSNLIAGTSVVICVLKGIGSRSDPAAPNIAPPAIRLYVSNVSGNLRFQYAIDENADEVIIERPSAGGLNLNQVYRHHVKYDITGTTIEWTFDGVVIDSRALSVNNPQAIQHRIHGSSGSSNGTDFEWALRSIKRALMK